MDELLGSALLALHLGEAPKQLDRIPPQEAADRVASGEIPENTYFIDCGLVLDEERGLFDHHQDRSLDSAALLIFNEYFPSMKNTELHDYIKLVSKVDTKGAMSLNDFHLVGESRDYFSFGQGVLLTTFQNNPMLVLKIFIAGLDDKISFEKLKQKASEWLDEPGNMEILEINNVKVIRYQEKAPSELVAPLRSVISKIADARNITAILSFDDKQPGVLTLFRTNFGHNSIDFSKSRPSNEVFNHKGGFLMKFIPSNDKEWIRLIKESL